MYNEVVVVVVAMVGVQWDGGGGGYTMGVVVGIQCGGGGGGYTMGVVVGIQCGGGGGGYTMGWWQVYNGVVVG